MLRAKVSAEICEQNHLRGISFLKFENCSPWRQPAQPFWPGLAGGSGLSGRFFIFFSGRLLTFVEFSFKLFVLRYHFDTVGVKDFGKAGSLKL